MENKDSDRHTPTHTHANTHTGRKKTNKKPLKTKFEKIEKQNIDFCGFGSADDENDSI